MIDERTKTMLGAALLLALFAVGCGSLHGEAPATAASTAQGQARFGALPAQQLAAGECGLFLFSRAPQPQFIFFADTRGSALVRLDGRELHFVQQSESAQPTEERILSFSEKTQGLSIALALKVTEAGSESEVSSGSLRLIEADGWESIVPVGGAIACQSG